MSGKKLHQHWNQHPLCEMRCTRWFNGSWKFVESDLNSCSQQRNLENQATSRSLKL